MKLSQRVDNLEGALVRHLEESGTIRTDLAWLKKAFWTLAVAIVTAQVAQFLKNGASNVSNMPQVQQITRNSQGQP